jgi:hypothetical protein
VTLAVKVLGPGVPGVALRAIRTEVAKSLPSTWTLGGAGGLAEACWTTNVPGGSWLRTAVTARMQAARATSPRTLRRSPPRRRTPAAMAGTTRNRLRAPSATSPRNSSTLTSSSRP